MIESTTLTGLHLQTYESLLQRPVREGVTWPDVYALLRQWGEVEQQPNGDRKIVRNGHTLVLQPPRSNEVGETGELIALREFLTASDAVVQRLGGANHLLLVIDHHEARLFRTEIRGGIPQQILPHEPGEYFRHAHNSKDFSRGQEKPDPNSFFDPVARALGAIGNILIFGSGTGMSNEMNQFVAWLTLHHPEKAKRIVGALVVNEQHLTVGQLLAKAREFYAALPAA